MRKVSVFLGVMFLVLCFSGAANASPYTYSFSVNGGISTLINPLSGTDSANVYYDYHHSAPHPAFGAEDNTAFFWLWEETDTGKVSLSVAFDSPGGAGGTGRAHFTLSGLPSGWLWTLQDDNGDIGDNYDTTPTWYWDKTYGDGGVIGGLEGAEWDINWNANSNSSYFYGISNWYFLSAGADKHANAFSLIPGSTLTISSNPVPEPTTMLLLGSGLIGLAGVGRKRFKE